MELSNFDSEISTTAALERQSIGRNPSVLCKRRFMLMWNKPKFYLRKKKCSSLFGMYQKTYVYFHSVRS